MITWEEFLTSKNVYDVIDITTIPSALLQDYVTRNHNVINNFLLCSRCNGTGNDFMFKYHRCTSCVGAGYLSEV